MTQCPSCNSEKTSKKGKEYRHNKISQRFRCNDCGINFYDDSLPKAVEVPQMGLKTLVVDGKDKSYVITCAVNDIALNEKFLATLQSYCKFNDAELLIVPVKYQQGLGEGYNWPSSIEPYFIKENVNLTNGLKLLAGINVSPAINNPLTGFENFSKGDSIIIPHPQMQMKSIAISHVDPSAIMTTTGAITEPVYTPTKQGEKGAYNHSYSALIIEEDKSIDGFHFRVLNSSETGSFYDLSEFYDGSIIKFNQTVEAIVLGDEHIIHRDEQVTKAHFTNEDSMVNVLKPKYIVRHDSLDFYSGSHWHDKNIFTSYAKHHAGKNDIRAELDETIQYVLNTTPLGSKSVIISSNHNSHLFRWLNENNPKQDPTNALLYHQLMVLMLNKTKMEGSMATYPNPFELWWTSNYNNSNTQFVGEQSSFKVHGIELAFHSDKGTNGARGSIVGFSKLSSKTIIGHSHSPAIFGSSYQVGTSSLLKLDYNSGGASSWGHADCIIHKNGKRQMVFIIKGKWRH